MPDLNQWMTRAEDLQPINVMDRAALAWRRIQRDPSTVIIIRDGVLLDSQTFRVESDNIARTESGGSPLVARATLKVTLFGIQGHRTLTDSDILRSDRFELSNHPGAVFEVMSLLTPPGEVQALCEAVQGS